jgi:hypothetical protein
MPDGMRGFKDEQEFDGGHVCHFALLLRGRQAQPKETHTSLEF